MRSVPAGCFERAIEVAALWHAYQQCRHGKARQPRMAAFDLDADQVVVRLSKALARGSYRPAPWRTRVIRDPKVRIIAAPAIADRIVHRAVLNEIAPTFERSFVPQSYARGRGLGPHRAVLALLGGMRTHGYRLVLDVRRYFPTVHRPTLLDLICERLRPSDRRMADLLALLLEANGSIYSSEAARRVMRLDRDPLPPDSGLGLGSFLSQWCGALYLDGLDHYVLRVLRPGSYLRYMDDLVVLGDDPEHLAGVRDHIAGWLREHRFQELDPKRRHVVSTREACVYLGYRVSRAGITPSRKLRRRFQRRVAAAAQRGPEALRRTLIAYRGLLGFGA